MKMNEGEIRSESYRFTNRVKRIMEIAVNETSHGKIYPIHFFIGACKEGSGVCAELFLYLSKRLGVNFLEDFARQAIQDVDEKEGFYLSTFKTTVSSSMMPILQEAERKMHQYKQVYMNEGHIIGSILENDQISNSVITEDMKKEIINLTSVARDMIVSLKDYSFPEFNLNHVIIRKARPDDYQMMMSFVRKEFGERWIVSLQNGFGFHKEIPIFIAQKQEHILGFACYDVVRNKKGLFGPMGVSMKCRSKGVGVALLHHCLNEMKQIGYEYAIIGQAGPIEFYERSCGAVLIPKH